MFVEKTRILIGINTDEQVLKTYKESQISIDEINLNSYESKLFYKDKLKKEFEDSDDLEIADLYLGLPMFIIFLILFAFTNLKIQALIFLSICAFLLIPINMSKKNRMYKILILLIKYGFKNKNYCFFKQITNENKFSYLKSYIMH